MKLKTSGMAATVYSQSLLQAVVEESTRVGSTLVACSELQKQTVNEPGTTRGTDTGSVI